MCSSDLDGRTPRFAEAMEHLKAGRWAQGLYNRMEAPVFALHPELAALKARLQAAGCEVAMMSGSGPTIFGLCADEAAARGAAAAVSPLRSTVAPFVDHGVSRLC